MFLCYQLQNNHPTVLHPRLVYVSQRIECAKDSYVYEENMHNVEYCTFYFYDENIITNTYSVSRGCMT